MLGRLERVNSRVYWAARQARLLLSRSLSEAHTEPPGDSIVPQMCHTKASIENVAMGVHAHCRKNLATLNPDIPACLRSAL